MKARTLTRPPPRHPFTQRTQLKRLQEATLALQDRKYEAARYSTKAIQHPSPLSSPTASPNDAPIPFLPVTMHAPPPSAPPILSTTTAHKAPRSTKVQPPPKKPPAKKAATWTIFSWTTPSFQRFSAGGALRYSTLMDAGYKDKHILNCRTTTATTDCTFPLIK